ncbi:MAG: cell division protein FtsA [Magnetovibrio sp.]|nr:cell division protein FtsA [Magnetovibrio sp.]|tara:strand:- start:44 stop:1333 length:1290 start_codon:yes stop_codon:yes gene_type:complete
MLNSHTKKTVYNEISNKVRSGPVAALDLGTTKACCLIAKPKPEGGFEVNGIGHQISRGIRSGTIIDMERTESTIRSTIEAAEQMAGENIRNVIVNLSCGEPISRLIAYEISIAGHEIGDVDLRRLLDPSGLVDSKNFERELVHLIPVGYSVDGDKGVRDPRGLHGQSLGVNMHIITAASGPLRNLEQGISRCHLNICGKVITPFASALACVSEDEANLGVTCIDMGGGTTTMSVFFDGELVFVDSIPIGGAHVTNDVARGLSTPFVHAERMKTLYGSAIPTPSDNNEIIKVPLIGEEETGETNQVPRSVLIGIIRPRVEETLEIVRDRLIDAGFDKVAGRRIVITGGASQLSGVKELAGKILDKQVRCGKPDKVEGLAESVAGPAFSTSVGLLHFVFNNSAREANNAYKPADEPNSHFARFGQWLRESF